MRLKDFLLEVPMMVPQTAFPFDEQSLQALKAATARPHEFETEARHGDITITRQEDDEDVLVMFKNDLAIAIMELTPSRADVGRPAFQVFNVWMLPEHRNQRLGLLLYNHVLHHRKHAFASGAAMTPASRRVYTSFLRDPKVEAYAISKDKERLELHEGPDGVTTGDPATDNGSIFVLRAV